jgi:uncharacterized membrane-anchored protein YhcB (DUF1043 family)
MGDRNFTRLGRAVGIVIGLVLGITAGCSLAHASGDDDYFAQQYQQALQNEARQVEQRNAETMRQFQESAKESIRAAEQKQHEYTPGSHSFSYVSPSYNEGRPAACTTNGQSTYCP